MPVLSNARHERFAQEIAAGSRAADAYAKAGYNRSKTNASSLKNRADVSERIRELQDQMANNLVQEITRDHVLRWLQEDRDQAKRLKQTASAVRAAELLGKELGMFVDKSQRDLNVIQHVGDKPIDEREWLADHKHAAAPAPSAAAASEPEHAPVASAPIVQADVNESDTQH